MADPRRYRKRPVTIEAVRWAEYSDLASVIGWVVENGGTANALVHVNAIEIGTLEGVIRASLGDWVVRGVKGEFYPVRPDIFEATYEAV